MYWENLAGDHDHREEETRQGARVGPRLRSAISPSYTDHGQKMKTTVTRVMMMRYLGWGLFTSFGALVTVKEEAKQSARSSRPLGGQWS